MPRIIGLSGSLTSASVKPQNLVADLEELEAIFRSTIATVKGSGAFQNVLLYSARPREYYVEYDRHIPNRLITKIISRVVNITMEIEDWTSEVASLVDDIVGLLGDFNYQINDFGE